MLGFIRSIYCGNVNKIHMLNLADILQHYYTCVENKYKFPFRLMRRSSPNCLHTDIFDRKLILGICFLFFLVIVVKSSWIAEDAYITLRTVDNFVHGFGLRWNVAERVQVYTHPLWMFLLSLFYAITGDSFLMPILLGVVLSLVTVYFLGKKIAPSGLGIVFGIGLLTMSKAFIDYSTSGLENSLTHLLLVLFYVFFFNHGANGFTGRNLLILSFITALGVLNRMDTLLLYFPSLVFVMYQVLKRDDIFVVLKNVFIGFIPFVIWSGFSLLYYGFLFPNTAYAKLNTGIPQFELVQQGMLYVLNSISWDPVTLFVIFTACVIAWCQKVWKIRFVMCAIVLYIIYVVKIGGDFMSGRFFAAPFLVAVVILTSIFEEKRKWMYVVFLIAFGLSILSPRSPFRVDDNYTAGYGDNGLLYIPETGIADERGYFYQHSGLLKIARDKQMPDFEWVKTGEKAMKEKDGGLVVGGAMGMFGFKAGPNVRILDLYALTDPLLARLSAIQEDPTWAPLGEPAWRIGHFKRALPEGYTETISYGRSLFTDPYIATYYEILKSITQDQIFSVPRLVRVVKMNLGKYDYLLEEYEKRGVLKTEYKQSWG